MKNKTSHLLLLLLVLSTQALAQTINLPALSSSITLSNPIVNNNMFAGIDNNSAQEGYTEATTVDGVQCRRIPQGKFLYINSSRAAVPTASNNIIISITYLDNTMNALWMNYTRSGNPNGWGNGDFQKSKTGKWITRLVSLTDAGLDGSMGYSGDIRIGGPEDNYIKEIAIHIGKLNPDAEPLPTPVNDPNSEFIGKSFAGYQLWHQAGPNAQDWKHWAYDKIPAAGRGNHNTEMFPIIADYENNPNITMYATNFANLGNGAPTRLYNSTDKGVIDVQMNLLEQAGFDGVAIQRNAPVGKALKYTATDDYYVSIKDACEASGRLFYVMYCMPDVNNGDLISADLVEGIKRDWVYQMEQIYKLTSSGAYATVNGKPIVELWGLGYSTISVDKTQALALAQFFKDRGCYVIAGTPRDWRLRDGGSRTDFEDVYKAYDMISPWTVGVYHDVATANTFKTNYLIPDKQYCDANGMDFYPVIFAGGAWSQHVSGYPNSEPREAGKFLWQQALNIKSVGLQSMYFAMLDEFEESTNIIGAGVDYFDIPTDQYFGTLSMDGIWTSSDYYLRLAAAASRMLTSASSPGEIPIPYSNGPIYHRNSFESRVANCLINNVAQDIVSPIDPRFHNDELISSTGVTATSAAIVNEPAFTKSGIYSVKITGTASAASSSYYYKMSETKIPVKANMQISFWKYSVNNLGQNTSIDLLFQSGKRLSNLSAYVDNNGAAMNPSVARGTIGAWQKFTCQIGTGELVGDVITGIIIGYNNTSATGTFTAYFDDVIIEDAAVSPNAPVVSNVDVNGNVGASLSFSIAATNTPTNYSAVNLPPGLTINSSTGAISGTPTIAATYSTTLIASNAAGSGSKLITITIAGNTQSPYGSLLNIPGKIEVENYDLGGEGISYHDADANNSGNFRTTEGVDVEGTGDTGGGYNVGWTNGGEWMEYTVNVQTTGTYEIQARVASGNAGDRRLHIELDGVDISGPIEFNTNGAGWQTYQTVSVNTGEITQGVKIMRLVIESGDFNFNYLNFNLLSITTDVKERSTAPRILLYPNPVKAGSNINFQFENENAAWYQVNLYNSLGQKVNQSTVHAMSGTSSYTLPQQAPSGYYQLEMINESGTRITQHLIVEE